MNNLKLITAFYTLSRKEFVRILRIWPQSLIPPATTAALYFLIFGTIIGGRVGEIHGFSYMAYILPGMIMNYVITNAFSNTSFSFFAAKFNHSIEEMLVSPMPNWIIILGHVNGGVLRGVLVGGLVFAISLPFIIINPAHPIFTMLVLILSAILFSLLGLINGLIANSFDDVSWIPSFIITPLTYLGGVFYAIESLPPVWQSLSHFNPIFYIVSAFRFGILGYSNIDPYTALLYLTIFNIISYAVAWRMMHIGTGIKQ